MKILIGCEASGKVRDAFNALGHDAWSCDLLPTDRPGNHYQCNVLDVLHLGWDMGIFFPDCTYLAGSGLHWNKRIPGRQAKTEAALVFVCKLLNAPIKKIALENPVGCISTRIKPASQYVQPYDYGDDASKKTGLWLQQLPDLIGTDYVEPRITSDGKKRWSNQTDSGQNRLGPSPTRKKERGETYPGIAAAMAAQWSLHG